MQLKNKISPANTKDSSGFCSMLAGEILKSHNVVPMEDKSKNLPIQNLLQRRFQAMFLLIEFVKKCINQFSKLTK